MENIQYSHFRNEAILVIIYCVLDVDDSVIKMIVQMLELARLTDSTAAVDICSSRSDDEVS